MKGLGLLAPTEEFYKLHCKNTYFPLYYVDISWIIEIISSLENSWGQEYLEHSWFSLWNAWLYQHNNYLLKFCFILADSLMLSLDWGLAMLTDKYLKANLKFATSQILRNSEKKKIIKISNTKFLGVSLWCIG